MFLGVWLVLISGPGIQLPFRTRERVVMTAILLASVVISGTFQVNKTKALHLSGVLIKCILFEGFIEFIVQHSIIL